MRRIVNTACIAGIQIVMLALLTFAFDLHQPANAAPIEPADRDVRHLRVSYAEPSIRNTMFFELNDGSAWRLHPCRFEDGRQCYWDAGTRGNHVGRSFIVVRGTRIFTNRI